MAATDFKQATAFSAAVPEGMWMSYGDVARAGGAQRPQDGARAVGGWLRREGDQVSHVYRVLNVTGFVADGFRPAAPGVPADGARVRDLLQQEGVAVDADGLASEHQRFRCEDWR